MTREVNEIKFDVERVKKLQLKLINSYQPGEDDKQRVSELNWEIRKRSTEFKNKLKSVSCDNIFDGVISQLMVIFDTNS